jgi:hypothetical protein
MNIMKCKIEKCDEHKSSLLVDKKNIDKSWEDELSQGIKRNLQYMSPFGYNVYLPVVWPSRM